MLSKVGVVRRGLDTVLCDIGAIFFRLGATMLAVIVTAFYLLVSAGIFDPESPRENVVQDGEIFGRAEVAIDDAASDGIVRVGV